MSSLENSILENDGDLLKFAPIDTNGPKPKFKLTQDHVKPELLEPLGDRYLVQIIEVDDTLTLSGGGILYRPTDSEKDRGWKAGVICSGGNGHLLGVPDLAAVLPNTLPEGITLDKARLTAMAQGAVAMTEEAILLRPGAAVPMFYAPGDVVIMERFAGRDLKLGPTSDEYCMVAQEHCLAKVKGLSLTRDPNGNWV